MTVDWPSGNHTVEFSPTLDQIVHLLENNGDGGALAEGCTYAVACNYSPDADIDNGTCEFACLCGPGTAWDEELSQCMVSCASDQNGDGEVGTADLIIFLTTFGQPCE